MNIGPILCIFVAALDGKRRLHCRIRLVGCRSEVFVSCFSLTKYRLGLAQSPAARRVLAQPLTAFQQRIESNDTGSLMLYDLIDKARWLVCTMSSASASTSYRRSMLNLSPQHSK